MIRFASSAFVSPLILPKFNNNTCIFNVQKYTHVLPTFEKLH